MNLELTKEQFRSLLDLVFAGNWLINTNRTDNAIEKYNALESFIFSKCGEAGLSRFCDKDGADCYPSADFSDSGIMELIDDHNEDTAMQELAEQLARRDLPHGLDEEQTGDYLERKYDEYMREFAENGFENVSVDLGPKDEREIKL